MKKKVLRDWLPQVQARLFIVGKVGIVKNGKK
jgi:hypothetical protein